MDEVTDKVSILCQELGLDLPAPNSKGEFVLAVDRLELRIFLLKGAQDSVVLATSLGNLEEWVEIQGSRDVAQLLLHAMRLHAARVKQLGLECVLTLEDDTLILWQKMDPYAKIPEFLCAAETLFNEAEFWQQKISASNL